MIFHLRKEMSLIYLLTKMSRITVEADLRQMWKKLFKETAVFF